jgi:hypothetical protein
MPMQINVGDHISSEATYVAVPHRLLGTLRWARTKANEISRKIPSANMYFRGLPGGRSLSALLADGTIWVNYAPSLPAYGETNMVGGKEIAIGPVAFRIGRWTVLATLIHELAHSNGAAGLADRAAEEAVLACRLGKRSERGAVDDPFTPYDPNIRG